MLFGGGRAPPPPPKYGGEGVGNELRNRNLLFLVRPGATKGDQRGWGMGVLSGARRGAGDPRPARVRAKASLGGPRRARGGAGAVGH